MGPEDAAVVGSAAGLFLIAFALTRHADQLSRVLYAGLLIEFVAVVLAFAPAFQNIVIVKDVVAVTLSFGLFLLWILRQRTPDPLTLPRHPLVIPVIVFFLAGILSVIMSPPWMWYHALDTLARNAAVILMFVLILTVVNTRRRWIRALWTVLACAALVSLYAFMQKWGIDPVEWGRPVNVSTFGNKDFFASFLTYAVPLALLVALGAESRFDAAGAGLIAALGLFHIIDGETRAAWVGLLAMTPLAVWFEWRHGRWAHSLAGIRLKLLALAGAVSLACIACLLMPRSKLDAVQSIFQTHRGTNVIRMYLWWGSLRMWEDRPLTGQGLGTLHLTFPYFRPDRYSQVGLSQNTRHAHSEEIELLAEQGILGFSAAASVVVIFFFLAMKTLGQIRRMPDRYAFFGLVAAIFAGLVHDSLNVNLRWTSSAVMLWFLLGLAARFLIGFDPDKPPHRKPSPAPVPTWGRTHIAAAVAAAALLAFTCWLESRILRADYFLRIAEGTVENPSWRKVGIRAGEEAIRLMPQDHSALYKTAYGYLQENEIARARDLYDRLIALAPNYAQVHQNTALLAYTRYIRQGDPRDLHEATLEFEWAAALENSFAARESCVQFYNLVVRDQARARHHHAHHWRNVQDHSFFTLERLWRSSFVLPATPATERLAIYQAWMQAIVDVGGRYWLERAAFETRAERPRESLRYILSMAHHYTPNRPELPELSRQAGFDPQLFSTRP